MIQSKVVADSIDKRGNRITSCLITFPRIILAELNTHRMLSKNSASSRAIPFNKMVQSVKENPFVPIAWQKEHKGMQGGEYITNKSNLEIIKKDWLEARDNAIKIAKRLNEGFDPFIDSTKIEDCVTKQLCNRLLEPFMWHTVLITGTDDGWNNFFDLRCPQYTVLPFGVEAKDENRFFFKSKKELVKHLDLSLEDFDSMSITDWLLRNKGQAEIHMMALAEAIYDSFNESTPKLLNDGEWHIPFNNQIDEEVCKDILAENMKARGEDYGALEFDKWREYIDFKKTQISTAMAARTSYTVVGDEKEVSYEKLIEIHDKMLKQKPFHASPFEHCARVMTDDEYERYIKGKADNDGNEYHFSNNYVKGWCRNYKGFIQYREIIEQLKTNEL